MTSLLMVPLKSHYDEYIDRPKLNEQKRVEHMVPRDNGWVATIKQRSNHSLTVRNVWQNKGNGDWRSIFLKVRKFCREIFEFSF